MSEKCFTLLDFNLVFWSELYGHSDEAFLCTNWMVLNKLIILYSTWTVLCLCFFVNIIVEIIYYYFGEFLHPGVSCDMLCRLC